jgi:hypothetical protein
MANDPRRREQRRTHLDASVVPVERALLARAESLETSAEALNQLAIAAPTAVILANVAAEFRALAEELHFW